MERTTGLIPIMFTDSGVPRSGSESDGPFAFRYWDTHANRSAPDEQKIEVELRFWYAMGWHLIQVMGVPTLSMATYLAIILLFLVMALYVGFKFEPLPAEELDAMVEEVREND